MEPDRDRKHRSGPWDQGEGPGVVPVGESVREVLDSGKRRRRSLRDFLVDEESPPGREYRARSPTSSERLNRALAELGSSAFKIHMLLWKWRGAPARGLLPFFTIHSLSRFCKLSRPTVRMALRELLHKGWIRPERYNKHHKNTLYRLVSIRKVLAPKEKPAG
ncbi:hypothetical protein ES705_20277 [subsurface metagenome]